MNKVESIVRYNLAGRCRADPGVIAQDIELSASIQPAFRKRSHTSQTTHIDFPPFDLGVELSRCFGGCFAFVDNGCGGWLTWWWVWSTSQDDVCAPGCESKSGFTTDTTVAASDDNPFSNEIDVWNFKFRGVAASKGLYLAPEGGRVFARRSFAFAGDGVFAHFEESYRV